MGRLYNTHDHHQYRRYLRTHQTHGEEVMWFNLRQRRMLGYRFRRQQGIGPFIVDFYCHTLRLAIEIDGASHESHEAMRYDRWRQSQLEKLEIRMLRFTDEELRGNVENVLRKIEAAIARIKNPPPNPLPKHEV
jgi:very-short-patch-repair endonuclease